jgi:hypothetical protein
MLNASKSTRYSFGMTQQRQDHGKAMQQPLVIIFVRLSAQQQPFVDSLKPVIENVIRLLGIVYER